MKQKTLPEPFIPKRKGSASFAGGKPLPEQKEKSAEKRSHITPGTSIMGKAMGGWRVLIVTTALIVVGKLGLHEYVRQDALHNVIVNAYQEHALAACRQRAGPTIERAIWAQTTNARVAIGKSDFNVHLWQTDHHLWNARYRNAYIYITVDEPDAQVHCEYDITNDIAIVYQLGSVTTGKPTFSNQAEDAKAM